MRGFKCFCALGAVMMGLSSTAKAFQTPPPPTDHPTFYVFSGGVPCGYVPDPSNDYLKQMVYVQLSSGMSAATAADSAASYVAAHMDPGGWTTPGCSTPTRPADLTNATICITFNGFGRDHADCDAGGAWHTSVLRFFTEDDRLPNYMAGSSTPAADNAFNFPAPTPPPPAEQPLRYVDRTYRHPFLKNARPESPLKAWMEAFVQRWVTEWPQLPEPTHFYVDVEPTIAWPGSMDEYYNTNQVKSSSNYVHILQQIYASRTFAGSLNLWSGVHVPGEPRCAVGTCTLRDIYLADKEKFGLPVYPVGHAQAGEPNLESLDGNTGSNTEPVPQPGSHPSNRRIMLWWTEVCERAKEAVLKNCLYDVVHAAWPNAKVGNYGSFVQGEGNVFVGAMQDSNVRQGDLFSECSSAPACGTLRECYHNDYYAHRGAYYNAQPQPLQCSPNVQMMPSGFPVTNNDAGLFWHINPDQDQGGNWISDRRWPYVIKSSSGTVDSPYLYPVEANTDRLPYDRIRQQNLFARKLVANGPSLLETRQEAGLRRMRHLVEATQGGGSNASGVRRLVPWLTMGSSPLDSAGTVSFSAAELAQEIAILRAKRIQEGIVYYGNNDPETAGPAWAMTERTIRNVYAPRIVKFDYTQPNGSQSQPIDAASEIDKLEDTLLSNGAPKTLDVFGTASGEGVLNVTLDDAFRQASEQAGLDRLVDGADGAQVFLVYVEATAYQGTGTSPATDVEFRLSCGVRNGGSQLLTSFDGEATVSSGRNPFGVVRCAWLVPQAPLNTNEPRLDPSKIMLVMKRSNASAFHAKVDLVQVIPYRSEGAVIDAARCYPALNLSTNSFSSPMTAPGTAFAQATDEGTFRIEWDKPIVPHYLDDQITEKYLRVYRYFGGPSENPLADVTCATQQTLENYVDTSGQHRARIYVRYLRNGSLKPMPAGAYQFGTYTRATELQGGCPGAVYPVLRTEMSGPLEGEPPVQLQAFWVVVPTASMPVPPPPSECVGYACSDPNDPPLRECVADVDDGSGTGLPDGGVTIDDLLYYLVIFEQGVTCADVDDGGFEGCRDGGVTIDDLLYYLFRFEAGC